VAQKDAYAPMVVVSGAVDKKALGLGNEPPSGGE